jgi:hypothetical protein
MADSSLTIPAVTRALEGAGHGICPEDLVAIEAVKRYIFAAATRRGVGQPYQGPSGPTPTRGEFPRLIDALRRRAALLHAPVDLTPLQMFWDIESRPPGACVPVSSGLVPQEPPTQILRESPTQPQWQEAAYRADLALNGLKAFMEARDEFARRPSTPTAEWCLQAGWRVRWEGEPVTLTPRLYQLLAFLLSRGARPIEATVVEEGVWGGEVNRKTFSNSFSALNSALVPIKFPWTWHVKCDHVHRESS